MLVLLLFFKKEDEKGPPFYLVGYKITINGEEYLCLDFYEYIKKDFIVIKMVNDFRSNKFFEIVCKNGYTSQRIILKSKKRTEYIEYAFN